LDSQAAVQHALGATPLTACRELLYHDVDLYAGAWDDGAFHRHGEATDYRKMFSDDCEYEINAVTCDNPRVTDLLEGNNLNMTGVVIGCHGANAEFHFHMAFCHFLLSEEHTVALLRPYVATAKEYVRCVYKVRC
jgi:hypothetical protein